MQPNYQQGAPQGAVDPFAPVPMTLGGGLPGARHLEGRVVIIKPVRVDETTLGFDKKTPAPTLIADIIVVDGGPLVYGDQVNNAGQQLKPPTHRVETPAMFRGWMDSHMFIVNPCRDMLRAGQPVTVGIIERGTQGNRPYFLTETHTDVNRQPRTDPSFAQRRQAAIDVYNAFQTGQWQPPTPVELNPAPAAAPAQPSAWNTAASAPPQPSAFTQAVAFPAPVGAQASTPPSAAGAWGQPAAFPALASAGGPAFDLSKPAPGYDALWPQLSEAQRLQVWQAQPGASAPAAPAPVAANAAPW